MKTKFIYTLSDPITKEVMYVGKTNNIKTRFSKHLSNNSLSDVNRKNNWIISLLRKDLLPIIDVVDEVIESDIDFYEIFYISLFKSWGFNLKNDTLGGDGYDWTGRKHKPSSNLKNKMSSPHRKSVAKLDKNRNVIKKYHSIREAGLDNNINKAHISRVCRGISRTAGGFKWEFIDKITEHLFESPINRIIKYKKPRIDSRMRIINVYDLNGNLLDTCISYSGVASKFNCHVSLIKNCCEKKGYYQTKGLTFRYSGDEFDYAPYKHYRKSKNYRIGMFSDSGDIIKTFNSLKDVVKYTGIGKQYISKVCKENGESGGKKLTGRVAYRFPYIFRFIQ